MARYRPRSEVVIALGLVAFIAVAFVKPWGSSTRSADTRPTVVSGAGSGPSATAMPSMDPITAVAAGTVVGSDLVLGVPLSPVVADGRLWYPADIGRLLRIDAVTAEAIHFDLDAERFTRPLTLASDGVNLWVTGADDGSIGVLDTSVGLVIDRIPANITGLDVIDRVIDASTEGRWLWFLADVHASQEILGTPCCFGFTETILYRMDLATGETIGVRRLDRPVSIEVGFESVWILAQPTGLGGPFVLDRLDRLTGDVSASIELPASAPASSHCGACITSIGVGSTGLWVPTGLGESLLRIDPAVDRVVATIDLGREAVSVVVAPDGYVWVAGGRGRAGACDPAAGYVAKIDPSTNRILGGVSVPCPVSLATAGGDVWVGTDGPAGRTVERVRPTR